jgi:hypothetical protein
MLRADRPAALNPRSCVPLQSRIDERGRIASMLAAKRPPELQDDRSEATAQTLQEAKG